MKKVLIIAYYFPPHTEIGSQRSYKLAKYFTQFGWEPIVLTIKLSGKPPEGVRIIATDYKDIVGSIKSKIQFNKKKGFHEQLGTHVTKNFNYPTFRSKIVKALKEIVAFPDIQRGWYKFALKSAHELFSKEKIDVIISTSSPVTAHLIARELKLKYDVPWVADLRDLWTNNHFYKKYKLIKYFEKRLEFKTLSDAEALVTVTTRFSDELKILHKQKKIFCITNGYDSDDFPNTKIRLRNKFIITHTGTLSDGKRDPSLLFDVLYSLINENKISRDLIEIRFYGPFQSWLADDIKKYKLGGIVNYYGLIPREEVLRKQKESQILLIVLDSHNKEESVYPAKVFEYFGARRPIIAIGGRGGIIDDLLEKTQAGKFASNFGLLRSIILQYYQEFIKFGAVKYCGNCNIYNYTYDAIANKYSEILNGLILK